MKFIITLLGPPGAALVSENSVFKTILPAKSVSSASFSDELVSYKGSALQEVDLCGTWRRLADRGGESEQVFGPTFDDSDWPQVKVPNNFGRDGELQRHYGPVWYRRTFRIGKRKYAGLIFRGVDYLADVWLNGAHLGHHEGYFAPFSFDISKLLQEKNTLAVRVQATTRNANHTLIFLLVLLRNRRRLKLLVPSIMSTTLEAFPPCSQAS